MGNTKKVPSTTTISAKTTSIKTPNATVKVTVANATINSEKPPVALAKLLDTKKLSNATTINAKQIKTASTPTVKVTPVNNQAAIAHKKPVVNNAAVAAKKPTAVRPAASVTNRVNFKFDEPTKKVVHAQPTKKVVHDQPTKTQKIISHKSETKKVTHQTKAISGASSAAFDNSKPRKQLNLFQAIIFLIGTVIGIGIFLKNGTIFKINADANNDVNGWGVLFSWVIGGLIAIATCVCFIEIGSVTLKHRNTGFSGWVEAFNGHRVGRFAQIFMPFCYFCFLSLIILIFVVELIFFFIWNLIKQADSSFDLAGTFPHIGYILLVTFVLWFALVAFNVYKQHASNLTVQILAYVKFVPLFAAIILGIVFLGNGGADSVNNLFTKFTENGQTKNDVATVISGVDLFALCVSLPPIFFATDGFTVTGSISTRIKNGQRNAPLAITIGMCIIIFIYIAITVAQIFTGAGSISALIPVVINNDVGAYLGIIVWCFIAFSAFATANGMLMSGISQAHDAIKGNYVVYSEKLLQKTKGKDLAAGGIAISVIGFIFALAFFIPAIFVESDAFMDVGTSIPSLVAFLLYGIVIFGALLNRYTKKVAVQRSKFLLPCGILAVIGIAFSVAFTFFYDNLYTAFIEKPFEINTSVGGFNYGYNMINYLTKGILTWLILILFAAVPFVNDLLIKLTNKKYGQKLIWQ